MRLDNHDLNDAPKHEIFMDFFIFDLKYFAFREGWPAPKRRRIMFRYWHLPLMASNVSSSSSSASPESSNLSSSSSESSNESSSSSSSTLSSFSSLSAT